MKRIFSQKTLLLVLALGLTASLTLNIALLQKQREEVPLDLRGTYQVGPMYGAIYLLLDGEGHFCRYTQATGVLDEGTCREQGTGIIPCRPATAADTACCGSTAASCCSTPETTR